MKKISFEEIIDTLESIKSNCRSDVNSEWIEPKEKCDTVIDINILNSIISHMKRIGENPKSRVFEYIKLNKNWG